MAARSGGCKGSRSCSVPHADGLRPQSPFKLLGKQWRLHLVCVNTDHCFVFWKMYLSIGEADQIYGEERQRKTNSQELLRVSHRGAGS